MARRLRGWLRTWTKLALLILGYFWIGAAYKLVYAQTHDLTRLKSRLPIPYYEQHFLVDSVLHQTWMFGPAFRDLIGELPSIGALSSRNTIAALADYCRKRERRLAALPERYPYSLFSEEALDDAYFFSQYGSIAATFGTSEKPTRAISMTDEQGNWLSMGVPETVSAGALAKELADGYPDSPQAPNALLRVAQSQVNDPDPALAQGSYLRLLRDYPGSKEAQEAAEALYRSAVQARDFEAAERYKNRALRAAEQFARTKYPGAAPPAPAATTILGFRVDLSGLNVGLGRLEPARELLDVASGEERRLRSLKNLPEDLTRNVEDTRQRLRRTRSELWVLDLFRTLDAGAPGFPPKAREFPVQGRILLNGRPFAGAGVGLRPGGADTRPDPMNVLNEILYRAIADKDGRYVIPSVPSGSYRPALLQPVHPAEDSDEVIAPIAAGDAAFPTRIEVAAAPVTLPDVHLQTGLRTLTFGEVTHSDEQIVLRWEAVRGAMDYRVEVLPSGRARDFHDRVPGDQREAFHRHPVLWAGSTSDTQIRCPLKDLSPDADSRQAAAITVYQYQVTALDAGGNVLLQSAWPLSRFILDGKTRAVMLSKPPPEPADPQDRARVRRFFRR
jgi:hypothetical protein